MTYDEIAEKYPEISAARNKDKLRFRYPNGESYLDVIGRLDPLVCWIERQHHPIAIFGHQAILRCLSAYFYSVELELIPYIDIPLHTIIRMTPETYTFR
jgi:6-phosphofructo-2-kinase/fructose-2,6-biphosphatase 2